MNAGRLSCYLLYIFDYLLDRQVKEEEYEKNYYYRNSWFLVSLNDN
ncbi:MAG: hypothetical protein M1391_10730 [Bacteroidetes bacterium]|nr:hypothetical protein [Bacteroidota bacterium]